MSPHIADELSGSLGLQLLRARKVLTALQHRPYRRALRLGVLPAIDHRDVLRHSNFGLIVDVGANRGQFLLAAARDCPTAQILCYEPLDRAFAVLQQVASAYHDRVRCYQIGLSDQPGEATMFVTRDDDNSSLRAPTQTQLTWSRGSAVAETAQVSIDRLDARTELAFESSIKALLKIDVQGLELAVLQGSTGVLRSFSTICVECSFVELYTDQPMADEVARFLEGEGFRCSKTYNVAMQAGRQVQADILFTRI